MAKHGHSTRKVRDDLLDPFLKRLIANESFCDAILAIRIRVFDEAVRVRPAEPIDSVAMDYLPAEVKAISPTYEEVVAIFIAAAGAKMVQTKGKELRIHPFELLPPPDECEHWVKKAAVISELGYHANALKCLEQASALDDTRADVWVERGRAIRRLAEQTTPTGASPVIARLSGAVSRYEEAIRSYDSALARDPRNVDALYEKGACLIEAGRPSSDWSKVAEALICFRAVLRIDPSHKAAAAAIRQCGG